MLTGKQKRFLRSKAHHVKALFQIGKQGLTENFIEQLSELLEKRELVKIHVLQNCMEDKHVLAEELSTKTNAHMVEIIETEIVLYKQSEANQRVTLPVYNGLGYEDNWIDRWYL